MILLPEEKTASRTGTAWKLKHMKTRTKLEISASYKPWTSLNRNQLRGVADIAQHRDRLDLAFTLILQQELGGAFSEHRQLQFDIEKIVKNKYCDISQCPTRRKCGPLM